MLYNGVLSGVSLKGDSYFYENPLEAGRQRTRWAWHGCPCCPPMFLKIMGALPGYIYAQDPQGVYVNLFVGSRAELTVGGGKLKLRQTTRYPWDGSVRVAVDPERPAEVRGERAPAGLVRRSTDPAERAIAPEASRMSVAMRASNASGNRAMPSSSRCPCRCNGSTPIRRWKPITVAWPCSAGPIVYCLEGCDHGGSVRNLVIPPESALTAEHRADFLGGVTVIRGGAQAVQRADWRDSLYLPASRGRDRSTVDFLAIPYFANANRQPAEMRVWMAETPVMADAIPRPSLAADATAVRVALPAADNVAAMNDGVEPAASDDMKIPRFTWWDHRGTSEWAQYDFKKSEKVSSVEVYWWDERRINAQCRVPQSWRVLYQKDGGWHPVGESSARTVEMDRFNRVTFKPVETKALRLEVQLQPGWSGGILEWRAD